jgi:hypothetical protein
MRRDGRSWNTSWWMLERAVRCDMFELAGGRQGAVNLHFEELVEELWSVVVVMCGVTYLSSCAGFCID